VHCLTSLCNILKTGSNQAPTQHKKRPAGYLAHGSIVIVNQIILIHNLKLTGFFTSFRMTMQS